MDPSLLASIAVPNTAAVQRRPRSVQSALAAIGEDEVENEGMFTEKQSDEVVEGFKKLQLSSALIGASPHFGDDVRKSVEGTRKFLESLFPYGGSGEKSEITDADLLEVLQTVKDVAEKRGRSVDYVLRVLNQSKSQSGDLIVEAVEGPLKGRIWMLKPTEVDRITIARSNRATIPLVQDEFVHRMNEDGVGHAEIKWDESRQMFVLEHVCLREQSNPTFVVPPPDSGVSKGEEGEEEGKLLVQKGTPLAIQDKSLVILGATTLKMKLPDLSMDAKEIFKLKLEIALAWYDSKEEGSRIRLSETTMDMLKDDMAAADIRKEDRIAILEGYGWTDDEFFNGIQAKEEEAQARKKEEEKKKVMAMFGSRVHQLIGVWEKSGPPGSRSPMNQQYKDWPLERVHKYGIPMDFFNGVLNEKGWTLADWYRGWPNEEEVARNKASSSSRDLDELKRLINERLTQTFVFSDEDKRRVSKLMAESNIPEPTLRAILSQHGWTIDDFKRGRKGKYDPKYYRMIAYAQKYWPEALEQVSDKGDRFILLDMQQINARLSNVEGLSDFESRALTDMKAEASDVSNRFFAANRDAKWRLNMMNVRVLVNEGMREKFLAKAGEFESAGVPVQPSLLYHGTNNLAIRNIAKMNFLHPDVVKKLSKKEKQNLGIKVLDNGYFGKGIYFGFSSDYAHLYVRKYHRQQNEPFRMLMCKVLPGNKYKVNSKDKKVFGDGCKKGFHSHESVEGNELVVFHPDQVMVTHVVQYEEVLTQSVNEEKPVK
uniref:PARP catalytic domain-containing protein n=1 Tax=Palpitomonas bilix TaxID=652834 RepID=A0A7S3DCY7_9EUKA